MRSSLVVCMRDCLLRRLTCRKINVVAERHLIGFFAAIYVMCMTCQPSALSLSNNDTYGCKASNHCTLCWCLDHVQFGDGDLLLRHVKVDIVMIVHNHTKRLTNYAERNPEDDIADKWLLYFALEPLSDDHHWHLQSNGKYSTIWSVMLWRMSSIYEQKQRHDPDISPDPTYQLVLEVSNASRSST